MVCRARIPELVLAAIAVLVVAAASAFTWWNAAEDRELTRLASTRLTDALVASVEQHIDAALRDAGNAGYSAAVLIENAGGFGGFRSFEHLHKELKRELVNEQSTARLVAVDPAGRVVASSAEYPLAADLSLAASETFRAHAAQPARQQLRLGLPQRSAISGEWVLPYSRAMYSTKHGFIGVVVAELRLEHFIALYNTIVGSNRGSVVVMNRDGILVIRAPFAEHLLGARTVAMDMLPKMLEQDFGNFEYSATRDGITRLFSYRAMKNQPLLVAIGLAEDEVMAGWKARTRQRVIALAAGSLTFLALVATLVFYLRRLVRSEAEVRRLNAELEKRVAERTAELERVNGDLEAFSYSVAHDLRGPLHRISSFAQLLRRDLGVIPPAAERRFETIARQTKQMGELIKNLLALARTSRASLRKAPVALSALVAEVREQLSEETEGRNVRWEIGPLPEVQADAALLRDALANLMGNAVKFTRGKDPAVIGVGVERDAARPGEVVVCVRDNGAGFDMEHAGKLFTAFHRMHSTAEFEGTGLGLSNVQRIVERHGGRAWAQAAPGAGATFRFSLPG